MQRDSEMEVFRMVVFFGFIGLAISAPVAINEDIFTLDLGSGNGMAKTMRSAGGGSATRNQHSGRSRGDSSIRNQQHIFNNCPINFSKQNYTILTSQCKPPRYDATLCCTGFKQFACPLADQVNKVKANYCALLMLKSLRTYANYKNPVMFLDKCMQSKLGMSCADIKSPSPAPRPGKYL